MNTTIIDFTSKQCKQDQHQKCSNNWNGLGFEIICRCVCHNKKYTVLERSGKSSNTTTHHILSLEEIKHDNYLYRNSQK